MKVDKYTTTARIYPTLVTLVPITIFLSFFVDSTIESVVGNKLYLKLAGNISISVVAFYFLIQLTRFIGKEFFEKIIFSDELRMKNGE